MEHHRVAGDRTSVFSDYSRLAAAVHLTKQTFPHCLCRTRFNKSALMAVLDVAQLLFALYLDPNPPTRLEDAIDMQNIFNWKRGGEEWVQLLELARNHVETH